MLFMSDKYTEGWVNGLRYIDENMPYRKECFYNALSQFEVQKFHDLQDAVATLPAMPYTVNQLASGFGLFVPFFLFRNGVRHMRLFDYDLQVVEINWRILNGLDVRCETADIIFDHEWLDHDCDMVINTSCENMWHMNTELDYYDADTLFLFQSTSINAKGRINIHANMDSFIESTGLSNIMYSKENNGIYTVLGKC